MRVTGKGNIWAEVVADSVDERDNRLVTFRLHYPRFIHAELMTHRMFSRNSSSSRAIPVDKVIEQVLHDPAMPIHWGMNQPGMQAAVECFNDVAGNDRETSWRLAAQEAVYYATKFKEAGYHKQVVNRLLEPFQFMNVIVSATDYDNFFYLRRHKDAQPEIHELADVMWKAYTRSTPELLHEGEWHTPFVSHYRTKDGVLHYVSEDVEISNDDAIAISSSCCAQVSYRKLDTSFDKAKDIFKRLVESEPIHASPFEHVARPMSKHHWNVCYDVQQVMINHGYDNPSAYYVGNLRGWVQYRKLLQNENHSHYRSTS